MTKYDVLDNVITDNMKSEKELREKIVVKSAIILELFDVIERLDGKSDILSIIGSYGDTLTDEEVVTELRAWNEIHMYG